MRTPQIEMTPVASLVPHECNARIHPKRQIRQLANSIKTFGWTIPLVRDSQNRVIAGNARLEAARLLGLAVVPTVVTADLREDQIRAYMLADNKLAESATWDRALLAKEFQFLDGVNIDLESLGFSIAEIDQVFDMRVDEEKADNIPPADADPVTLFGDTWKLGDHRINCGDATKKETYEAILKGHTAQMIFGDMPYNVPVFGHVSGNGKVRHREFAMASGEMTPEQFITFITTVFNLLLRVCADGAVGFLCMDWRHSYEFLSALAASKLEYLNLCVWNKNNGGMGSLYRSKHEFVHVVKFGTGPHINNVELGRHGRNRTNVWDYAGVNTFRSGRNEELAMHPTVKPVAMVADAILDCSKPRGIVLDPFVGSGTTIIAAEQKRRRAYAIEIDPAYVDVAVQRWQDFTGREAINFATGKTFDETRNARQAANTREGADS